MDQNVEMEKRDTKINIEDPNSKLRKIITLWKKDG